MNYPGSLTFDKITKRDVGQNLMGQFATFLFEDKDIQFSTSTTYLSSVKRQLEDKTQTPFFEQNKGWYKRLRYNLRSKYVSKVQEEGKSLQEKAPLMTMEDLETIGEMQFKRNNVKNLKDRCLVNFQWSMIGRSSDVAGVTFNDFQWMGS